MLLDQYLLTAGFKVSAVDPRVYYCAEVGEFPTCLVVPVDDFLLLTEGCKRMTELKQLL